MLVFQSQQWPDRVRSIHACTSLATGSSAVTRTGLSRFGKEAIGREPDSGVGAKNRPAGIGDRFFETVLAAHRRTADAAGVNWKTAIYQQVREEMSGNELAIERMCELAGVSRRGFYRFDLHPRVPGSGVVRERIV